LRIVISVTSPSLKPFDLLVLYAAIPQPLLVHRGPAPHASKLLERSAPRHRLHVMGDLVGQHVLYGADLIAMLAPKGWTDRLP
jgi:hypothetical protein